MEWESDSPCRSHTYHGQECWSPGRGSTWELEFRDCGAIPVWELLLTAERWIEGMWGRGSWWEMPVEESQAIMEARQYCWVMSRGWSHPHSLSLSTCQHLQLNNREAGPSNAWRMNYRVGPQARDTSKCLNGWSCGQRQAKETFWLPGCKRLNSCWVGNPCLWTLAAARVPASLAPASSSRSTLTGLDLPQAKKRKALCLCMQGHFSPGQLFVTL